MDAPPPATCREIYQGHVIRVYVETVRLPNGRTVALDQVRHPGAVAVVPLLPDGRVVLIHQYRHAAGGFIYEIPAGKLEKGEPPELCARREVEEETGYHVGEIQHLTTILTAPGFCDERIHLYLGTRLTPGHAHPDPDEVLRVVEMPLDEAMAQIDRQDICDAKSIVALQMVYRRQHALMKKKE